MSRVDSASFTPRGIPPSGGRSGSASILRARARAPSASTARNASTSSRAMASRCASTSSSDDTRPAANSAICSVALKSRRPISPSSALQTIRPPRRAPHGGRPPVTTPDVARRHATRSRARSRGWWAGRRRGPSPGWRRCAREFLRVPRASPAPPLRRGEGGPIGLRGGPWCRQSSAADCSRGAAAGVVRSDRGRRARTY